MASKHKLNSGSPLADHPRVHALINKLSQLDPPLDGSAQDFIAMSSLAVALERELNAADKVIADVKAYINDEKDTFPEDELWEILNRKEIK
jgi:hypothetical protein